MSKKSHLNKLIIDECKIFVTKNNVFIYESREDSELMIKVLEKEISNIKSNKIKILEIGTASGVIAFNLISKFNNLEYTAVDINKDVVKFVKQFYKKHKNKFKSKLNVIESDLFSKIKKEKFDIILFNPPYLPYQSNEPQQMSWALSGGKVGYELTEKFVIQAKKYLKKNGVLFFIATSIKDNNKIISKVLDRELYDYCVIDSRVFQMEEIFAFKAAKNQLLKDFSAIKFYDQGKHSFIYRYKKYVIKKLKLKNDHRYIKEKQLMRKLNKYKIGPKLVEKIDGKDITEKYLAYEYVEGIFVKDYFKDITLDKIIKINKLLVNQVLTLDYLSIKKEELTRITTNALISKDLKKITLIDFERSHYVKDCRNFNQYFEFLRKLLSTIDLRFELPKKTYDLLKNFKNTKHNLSVLKKKAKIILDDLFLHAKVLNYLKNYQSMKDYQSKNLSLTTKKIALKFKLNPRRAYNIIKRNNKPI